MENDDPRSELGEALLVFMEGMSDVAAALRGAAEQIMAQGFTREQANQLVVDMFHQSATQTKEDDE